MTRLRTVSADMPGWERRKHGRGFVYLADGERLTDEERERCVALAIPPAWTDVWICPLPNGHVQAVGTDEAGRRQYLYHPKWRERQDRAKYAYMLEFADALPRARATVRRHLKDPVESVRHRCALAFRMLDVGAFRIGSERYAEDNGSHGLLTLDREHVRLTATTAEFHYPAKSGQERELVIDDKLVVEALRPLVRGSGRVFDLEPEMLNDYVKERIGDDASAKYFRTWRANVVAAAALALSPAETKTARKRAVAGAMREVADHLGNTPAVARSGYVDPRLVDLYLGGDTIDPDVARRHPPREGRLLSSRIEAAVLDLLGE